MLTNLKPDVKEQSMVITDASTKLTELEIKKVGAQSEPDVQEAASVKDKKAADVEAVRFIKVRGRPKASSKKN